MAAIRWTLTLLVIGGVATAIAVSRPTTVGVVAAAAVADPPA